MGLKWKNTIIRADAKEVCGSHKSLRIFNGAIKDITKSQCSQVTLVTGVKAKIS